MQAVDLSVTAATFGNGLNFDTQPCLFPTLYKWLQQVPDTYADPQQQTRLSVMSLVWHTLTDKLCTAVCTVVLLAVTLSVLSVQNYY